MRRHALTDRSHRSFVRFLVSGVFNTAVTYGLYLILIMFLSYPFSYTIAYLAGILIAYLLNRFFVFKSHQGFISVLLLPIIYAVQYCMGLIVLWCWIEVLLLNEKIAPLVAVVITLPITFLLSKMVFSKRSKN